MAAHMVVTLIRHGLTSWNVERKYLGQTDLPLCNDGIAAVRKWVAPRAEHIFASDMRRAIQTAELLYPERAVQTLADLRECNFGDWEGKTYYDLYDDPLYQQWIADPAQVIPPNGEGFPQFMNRIQQGWEQLLQSAIVQEAREVVLVAHGGTIRALLSLYSDRSFRDWQIAHGAAVELKLQVEAGDWRCISLREVALTESENGC